MIKFFRKIRQKLLTENRTGQYLKYAIGEIVLVVIGILIALQINNWNEKSKLKGEEIKLLKEMKSALISDKEDIISCISEHSSAAKSCSILIEHISNGNGNDLPIEDFMELLSNWGDKEILKIQKKKPINIESKMVVIRDKVDTIKSLSINADKVSDLYKTIEEIFSDNITDGITI